MTVKVEVGGVYMTRGGELVYIVDKQLTYSGYPFVGIFSKDNIRSTWLENGWYVSCYETDNALVRRLDVPERGSSSPQDACGASAVGEDP